MQGGRITHQSPDSGIISIKAGGIDDLRGLRPVAHIWLRSALPFTAIPDDVARYDTEPDDFTEIFDLWRARV